jgi:hypothetical protein
MGGNQEAPNKHRTINIYTALVHALYTAGIIKEPTMWSFIKTKVNDLKKSK